MGGGGGDGDGADGAEDAAAAGGEFLVADDVGGDVVLPVGGDVDPGFAAVVVLGGRELVRQVDARDAQDKEVQAGLHAGTLGVVEALAQDGVGPEVRVVEPRDLVP